LKQNIAALERLIANYENTELQQKFIDSKPPAMRY
jgi:hypothetical protein